MNDANTPQPGDANTVGTEAGKAASAASDQVKGYAKDMAHEAGDYAEHAKATAADEVKGVSSALRTAAEELRSGSPQERAFSQIAAGLADASDAMRDKDLGEMAQSLTGFAKRNPLVFLGGAALVGFAATRFASASAHRSAANGDRNATRDDAATRYAPASAGTTAPRTGTPDAPGGTTGMGGVSNPARSTDVAGGQK